MVGIRGCTLIENVRENHEMVLFRGRCDSDARPVFVLSPILDHPPLSIIERLEKEFALKAELDDAWAVRPLELVRQEGKVALVLDDPGGLPLDRLVGRPWTMSECLRTAFGIASALARMHERGLIHKDIKPANLLVNPDTGEAHLMSFGLASRLPRERQLAEPPESISGTLAYMAPEQTGRMNRSIDSRSDLYSLGVTLYELFVGERPFTAVNPLDLIHCHIARLPVPPVKRRRPGPYGEEIPGQLSNILMKLLAKTAEERYQTASGLEEDLRRCLAQWEALGRIESFSLAEHDVSPRLLIPEKLYGREKESRALLEAFDRVVAGGNVEWVLVSGYSGVGKSSLVNELHKAIILPRGLFASGKFEQYKRGIPYAILAQTFKSLIRQLLVKPEEELAPWRNAMREALGQNGQLLVDLVPELEFLIGKQMPVPEFSPNEAKSRFSSFLLQFLGVFAKQEHPLTLFLDDLQWLDPATLAFLEYLVTNPSLRHLLIIGAYRDNEVSPSHPLLHTLDAIHKTGVRTLDIVLAPLSLEDLASLLSDMLHATREQVELLARLVQEKSAGNPFFVFQFLQTLYEDGLLEFHAVQGKWRWNIERIKEENHTDNVVDLMIGNLVRLSGPVLEAVKALACLGIRAEEELLIKVLEGAANQVRANLDEAERAGFLIRSGTVRAFIHDRVQEAAYSLIPPGSLEKEHLRIGRILLSGMTEERLDEGVFELVNHFNCGIGILRDEKERRQVRRMNFRAGRKAMAATAYAGARDYLLQAMALLAEAAWIQDYGETLSLMLALSECEYLVGHFEEAEALFNRILPNAKSNLDRAKVHSLRIKLYQVSGNFEEALKSGFEALSSFGIVFPETEEEIQAEILAEKLEVPVRLSGRRVAELVLAQEATDPEVRCTLSLFADLFSPVYCVKPGLFPLIVLKALNFSLLHGITEASCFAYSSYAILLTTVFEDVPTAIEFSEMSLEMNARFQDPKLKAPLLTVYGGLVAFWGHPFALCSRFLEQAFLEALKVGDLLYAGYTCITRIWNCIEMGEPLAVVQRMIDDYLNYVVRNREDLAYRMTRLYGGFLACMRGETRSPGTLDYGDFKAEEGIEFFRKSNFIPGLVTHFITKQIAAYIFGEYESSLEQAENTRKFQTAVTNVAIDADHHFYYALTLTALYSGSCPARQTEYGKTLDEILQKLANWKSNCPENFLNRYALVSAERARLDGRDLEAMGLYEQAIDSARENGLIQNESLACEVAARFYLERGLARAAFGYLKDARSGYLRWGAVGKVAQLERVYPDLEEPAAPSPTSTIGSPVGQLDLPNAIKASQAVSGEIELGALVGKLMSIVLDHAGADRGLLILSKEEDFILEAEATLGRQGIESRRHRIPVSSGQFSEAVFRYVVRTRESVVLEDASAAKLFSEDEYIRQRRSKSILCLPLLKQARLVGVLYLENSLVTGAFTPGRTALLKVLASQAAISLENARLYFDLVEERSRLEAVFRQVPVGLIIAEAPSGRMIVANEQLENKMGRFYQPAGSFKEYGQYLGLHPDGRRYKIEDWPLTRSIQTGETVTGEEIEMVAHDGTHGWIVVNSAPIRDPEGNITAGVVVVQDITGRKQKEDALQASEERFSKAFHSNPTPMAVIRRKDWILVDTNESFLQMLGYSREEVVGHYSMELGLWFMDILEKAKQQEPEGKPFRNQECLAAVKSGGMRSLLVSLEAILLEGEKSYLAAFIDVTEMKRVEEQLRQSQKMEAIGSLAGGIAHDFNNLLTAINGYSSLILQGMEVHNPYFDFVREILKSGERASGLTRQLLAYSRKQVLEPKVWNLNEIVADIEPMLRRLLGEDVNLGTALRSDIHLVKVDRGQVEQILMNLAVNARDAMPKGGRLILVTDNVLLDETNLGSHLEASPGPHVMLAVSDTGTGMTSEVKARLFEPFFTTKEVGKGTGLGLSVVYGIVKQSGGSISIYSELGKGTTFRIYFPEVHQSTELPLEPLIEIRPDAYRGEERILLVEDDASVRKFARNALEAKGYQVLEARTGKEALQVIKNAVLPLDLIISDLVMPDMGGLAMAKRLRKRNSSLLILFTSGNAEQAMIEAEIVKNGEIFLQKPFSPFELARKVREVLDKKRVLKRSGKF